MFAQVINGIIIQLIQPGVQWTYQDVTYPGNWIQLAGPGELADLGIVDVVYGQRPNDTYYWVTQLDPVYNAGTNQVDINFTGTPKDLFTVQSSSVTSVKNQAYSILLPSDWMVVRKTEDGTPIEPVWNTWRQTIRNEAASAVAAITAATTVDQVAAVFPVAWTPDPDTPVTLPAPIGA
jgi:hypothetical protein